MAILLAEETQQHWALLCPTSCWLCARAPVSLYLPLLQSLNISGVFHIPRKDSEELGDQSKTPQVLKKGGGGYVLNSASFNYWQEPLTFMF